MYYRSNIFINTKYHSRTIEYNELLTGRISILKSLTATEGTVLYYIDNYSRYWSINPSF